VIRLVTTSIAAAAIAAALSATAGAAPRQRVTPHAVAEIVPAEKLMTRIERPTGVPVFDGPGGRRLGLLPMRTEWGSRRVMPVLSNEGPWLRVIADVGNGGPAWVLASGRDLSLHQRRYSLIAHRSRGTVTVLDHGRVERTVAAAFGGSDSPTPLGHFAVTDRLSGAGFGGAYGCCIIALSGHQTRLPLGWTGGNRLAIHAPSGPWPRPSAGCLVASDADMRYLMRRAPVGTPVTIKP